MTSPQQTPLDTALALHRAGRVVEAETGYRRILAQDPGDPGALHLLGLLEHQAGRSQAAIAHLEQAVAIRPDPQFLSNLGEIYRAAGQFDRGIQCCQRAIATAPDFVAAHTNLAALLQSANRAEEGIPVARRAVGLKPTDGPAHRVLGNLLLMVNRLDEAAAELQAATRLNPQDAVAWANLGVCYERLGNREGALQCHTRAAQLAPQSAEMMANLGHALAACNRFAEAISHFQRAIQANPALLTAREGLAACLEQINRFDEAVAIATELVAQEPRRIKNHCVLANALLNSARVDECEAALRNALLIESYPDLHQILSVCLTRLGRLDEAIREIDIAISMRPNWVEGHFSKALILMFAGRYEEAWPCYEWRWKHPRMDSWRHNTDKPLWDGSPLDGKRILLFAEQGLGDTFQAMRYATLVAQRGGHVILEVQPGLKQLAGTVAGVKEVLARGEPVPPFGTYAALMSLPGIFRTSLQTIPAAVPYIHADPAKIAAWRQVIGDAGGKFKIGIAWQGGPFLRENFLRSMPLSEFAPLAAVPAVRFYSLQRGPGAEQVARPPQGMDIIDIEAKAAGFSDTAAIMCNLDLVIAVDTAVIHAAGALGLPVWNLQSRNLCGHMWMTDRTDTPWYPTMRIFRQAKLGDWPPVMQTVAAELRKLVEARK